MKTKYTKPVLSADGLSELVQANAWKRYYNGETCAQFITRVLDLCKAHTLSFQSHISVSEEPGAWEYDYLTRGFSAPRFTFEEYQARRLPYVGATIIALNFDDLSCAFHMYTRDASVIEAFHQAFADNPGADAIAGYRANLSAEFDRDRKRFEKRKETSSGY
jgi:hypothetical protein